MREKSYLEEVLEKGICPQCEKPKKTIQEQWSYGLPAGIMCMDCAKSKYRDQCGHGTRQGSPSELIELGETYWEE
jgi:hypothetical protein